MSKKLNSINDYLFVELTSQINLNIGVNELTSYDIQNSDMRYI